jgi:hypothetical protein
MIISIIPALSMVEKEITTLTDKHDCAHAHIHNKEGNMLSIEMLLALE